MADVQLEHGHFKIANRLAEAILAARFGAVHLRLLLGLLRVTYGWRRHTVKCTETELARWSGMEPGPDVKRASGTFRQALRELTAAGVIVRVDGARGSPESTFSIEKDFARWGQFSSAEGRLESVWGKRPGSDDATLRTMRRAEQQASDMAQDRANPSSLEDGPDSGHANADDVAQEQATSKSTWPAHGPSHGPAMGQGTGPNSLFGETYEAGKTLKDSSTPLTITDPKTTTSIFSAESPSNVAVAERENPDGEPPPVSAFDVLENGEPSNGLTGVDPLASSSRTGGQSWDREQNGTSEQHARPIADRAATRAPERPEIDLDAVRQYAIRMSTAANAGIAYRWGEQPNPVNHVTGINAAEELIRAGVPLELARATIASVCHACKLPVPPKSLEYFRVAILDAQRSAEQRAYNAADPGAKRGGPPTAIALLVDPEKAKRDQAAREAEEREYQTALTQAAVVWGTDPANSAAHATILAETETQYAGFPAKDWVDAARKRTVIERCAKAARFPDLATWRANRLAANGLTDVDNKVKP